MKKQQKTYLLLLLVGAIWSLLGFKIFRSLTPEEAVVLSGTSESFKPLKIKERDTFSISADYRDPFLGTLPKARQKTPKSKAPVQVQKLPEKQIVYSGFITDTSSGNKIFFLTVDGQQQMLSKREEFQGVRLLSGNEQHIRVRYNGKIAKVELTQ